MPVLQPIDAALNLPTIDLGHGGVCGRDPGTEFTVGHPTVSRRHAQFTLSNGWLRVIDLGSANGTFVNGKSVDSSGRDLVEGDVVQFGAVLYRVADDVQVAAPKPGPAPSPPAPALEHGETVRAGNVLERELAVAAYIQDRIVAPPVLRGEYSYAQAFTPASSVSGDFLQLLERNSAQELWLMAGDVCGKGIPASLYMAYICGAARTLLRSTGSPQRLLYDLGEMLRPVLAPGMFATCAVLSIDLQSHRCQLGLAGHPPPLLRRTDGSTEVLVNDPGLPLGIDRDVALAARSFTLQPGELVLVYSDGVDECQNPAGQHFGDARIAQVLSAHESAETAVKGLGVALDAFRGRRAFPDDTSYAAIMRAG